MVIHRKLGKLAYSILAALGMGTIVSCYGMPVNGYYSSVYGKVTAPGNNALQGIKVTISKGDSHNVTYTGAEGSYYLEFLVDYDNPAYTIEFKDVDGSENGSFKTKSDSVSFNNDTIIKKDIELEENS
ncbi:MAG: radical SAM-associated putative lipoprotein [Treponemataceae bacterium]|nr:radical SAM-associated putative lipoprotein [Treponemataceae bacterium]